MQDILAEQPKGAAQEHEAVATDGGAAGTRSGQHGRYGTNNPLHMAFNRDLWGSSGVTANDGTE